LSGEIKAIYGRDLQRRLTPMLAGLAADRLGADMAQPATLYDDLKSYLILGGRGPIAEGHALAAWVQPAWQAQHAGPDAQVVAADAARHTQALVDFAFKPVAIDTGRVEAARTVIRAQPAAVRVYGRLKSEALARNDAIWSARDNAGPQPTIFFAEQGAFAPGAGVPKLFTKSGYQTVFLPALASGPKLLDEERWVVGDVAGASPALGNGGLPQLKTDLSQLYFQEFLNRWRDYMGAMRPKPAANLQEVIQRLRDGSGPLSPLPPLLRAIAAQTDMTPDAATKAVGALPGASLMAAAGLGGGPAAAGDPRNAVVQAFAPLRLFVGKPGAPGPLDAVLQQMGTAADKLNMVAVLPGGGGATGSQASLDAKAAIAQLEQSGATMPAPAGTIVQGVAGEATSALGGARLSQVSGALDANFGAACRQVLGHGYPFQPAAAQDVALADFARLFGPQGSFATFVSQNLTGYVDTGKPRWEALPNAAEIHITPSDVMSFQQAAALTRAFFAADPTAPRLSYQIEPVALTGAKAVKLTVDGQTLSYDGKTPLPATFDWPGAGGATLAFTGDGVGEPRTWPGQWAAFRMMRTAAVRSAGGPTTGTGSLTAGGARFDFKVRTFTGQNPFVVDPFAKISCPTA
jgi:type VI secretion system protein ImpL